MTDGFSATAERYYDLQESAETERNMIFENDERRRERREATLRSKRNKSSHYATKNHHHSSRTYMNCRASSSEVLRNSILPIPQRHSAKGSSTRLLSNSFDRRLYHTNERSETGIKYITKKAVPKKIKQGNRAITLCSPPSPSILLR